jgi:hypothetical protein
MEQAAIVVAVPCGILEHASGKWISLVQLRRLDGYDERVLEELSEMPLHSRVLALLERVASFEDGETPLLLRNLRIGDRVALMLHLRRLELGDNLDCTVSCANCKKNMSVLLSAAELLRTRHPEPSDSYEISAGGFNLQIKPITAVDQDLLMNAKEGEDLRLTLARSRIISSAPQLPEQLPDEVVEAIGLKLEQVDPLSDIVLDLSCPECGRNFRASFNVEEFVLRELGTGCGDLESEIHWLALHYHWSEKEILALPIKRRRKYISLINSALGGGNSA